MKPQNATVIATFSRRMRLRLDGGLEVDARIRGKKLRPVCGDTVAVEVIDDEDDWLITAIHARRNELSRPNMRGEKEVLAANVDYLVAVAAATPKPDWYIVDRYLCAAELMGIKATLAFNKIDLGVSDPIDKTLGVYRSIGYPVVCTSATERRGIDELAALLRDCIAIVVGQSGTGKSSLINRLAATAEQKTAAVSAKRGEGRHTTVNSTMIELTSGGQVIDSPGVRDYAPVLTSASEAQVGYREVLQYGRDCRFANCRHLREPGCAVKASVDAERIDPRRYESYRRALALAEGASRKRF